jgi:hypothetical protein
VNRIQLHQTHIKDQFISRFKAHRDQADRIIDRLRGTLEDSTPDDWRFTVSPTSRFFIIDAETGAKFLGLSYRLGTETPAILDDIQSHVETPEVLFSRLSGYVDRYVQEVMDPNLPIIHEIRTVYGKKKAEIGEEKRLYERGRETLYHVIPPAAKKIAARPNAVLTPDETLWVRQELNWISMAPGSREFYFFNPLAPAGVDKRRCAIFSYTDNGDLKLVGERRVEGECAQAAQVKDWILKSSEAGVENAGVGRIRSESYWHVPTCLDRRFIDLEFINRYARLPQKAARTGIRITAAEILELFFLKQIIEGAKQRLYSR